MDNNEEKIIEAASLLFLRDGFAGTTMKNVSVKARLNSSLIHHYFRTKKDLYRKTLRLVMKNEIIPALESLNQDESIEDRLKILHAFREMLIKRYPRLPVILMDEKDYGHDVLQEEFAEHSFNLKPFERHIAERTFNTSFKEEDARFLLITLLSVSLFPYMFQDMIKASLNLNDEQYQKMLNFYYNKFFGM